MTTEATAPAIDPRMPAGLSALLAEHEIPQEEGALLWEIEKHGYYVCLTGPVEPKSDEPNPWRWSAALLRWNPKASEHDHSGLWQGQTARLALAYAVAWILGQRQGEDH